MKIKYIFVLGVGRSGTTFLERLLGISSSKIKMITEPFHKVNEFRNPKYVDMGYINPFDEGRIDDAIKLIKNGALGNSIFNSGIAIERDDKDKEVVIVKEVHSLLAFPKIIESLECTVSLIVRDTLRVSDSYFSGHSKKQRIYLIEEYKFIKKYIQGAYNIKYPLLDSTLKKLPKKMLSYYERPYLFTTELMRHVLVVETIKLFLIEFSQGNKNINLVSHEDICKTPIEIMEKIYDFHGLKYDEKVLLQFNEMTNSNNALSEFHSTNRDIRKELNKPYKFLSDKKIQKIIKFIK